MVKVASKLPVQGDPYSFPLYLRHALLFSVVSRSPKANRYMWSLVQKAAKSTGKPDELTSCLFFFPCRVRIGRLAGLFERMDRVDYRSVGHRDTGQE
jgi:hypothetical protein